MDGPIPVIDDGGQAAGGLGPTVGGGDGVHPEVEEAGGPCGAAIGADDVVEDEFLRRKDEGLEGHRVGLEGCGGRRTVAAALGQTVHPEGARAGQLSSQRTSVALVGRLDLGGQGDGLMAESLREKRGVHSILLGGSNRGSVAATLSWANELTAQYKFTPPSFGMRCNFIPSDRAY